MLKKFSRSLLLVLLLAPFSAAQFTLVSGTVTDPHGTPYALGTITAQLITAGTSPTINGSSFSMTASAGLNSAGSFTMQLVSNALMLPNTLQWGFTVCSAQGTVQPAGGTGSQCFSLPITISGATQSITATLSAAAPALTNPPGTSIVNAAGAVGAFYMDGFLQTSSFAAAIGANNLSNSTANAVWCDQFVLPSSFSINQISIRSALLGTDNVGIGIYSTGGTKLLAAVFTGIGAGVLGTSSTGSAVTLTGGTYYYCWAESSTSAGITYQEIPFGFSGTQVSTGAVCIEGSNAATAGTLPATLGTLNTLANCPAVIPYAQLNHS